jgi:hypothetical protein
VAAGAAEAAVAAAEVVTDAVRASAGSGTADLTTPPLRPLTDLPDEIMARCARWVG